LYPQPVWMASNCIGSVLSASKTSESW
jgi:hypothetical protein